MLDLANNVVVVGGGGGALVWPVVFPSVAAADTKLAEPKLWNLICGSAF